MLVNQALRMGARHSRLHAFQALASESLQQKLARRNLVDAPRLQVEQSVFFNLADGRAVGALHVVGVDFQLRLGVDLRIVGKQKITVGLLGVGLLRVLVYHDAAVENAVGMAVQDSVVELAAAAVRAGMLHVHVIVEMLMAIADKQAIDQALSTFAGQHRVHVVADQSAAEQKRMGCHVRTSILLNAKCGNVERIQALALDHVMRDRGVLARDQFRRSVAEHRAAAQGNIVLNDSDLALLLENQQVPRMNHAWRVGRSRHKQQMDWRVQRNPTTYVYECSVFGKSRVQGAESIALDVEMAAEMGFQRGRALLDLLLESRYRDICRQSSECRQAADKLSIDKHQLNRSTFHTPRLQVGFRKMCGALIGERKRSTGDRCDAGEAPIFIVRRREPGLTETRERILAQLSQPWQIVP